MLDDFIPDAIRRQLLLFLLYGDGSTSGTPTDGPGDPDPRQQPQQQFERQQRAHQGAEGRRVLLPAARWERRTTDMAGAAPTWGVRPHVLQQLASGQLPAMQVGLVAALLATNTPPVLLPWLPFWVAPASARLPHSRSI